MWPEIRSKSVDKKRKKRNDSGDRISRQRLWEYVCVYPHMYVCMVCIYSKCVFKHVIYKYMYIKLK